MKRDIFDMTKYNLYDSDNKIIKTGDIIKVTTNVDTYICTFKQAYFNRFTATLNEFNNQETMFAYVCIKNIENLQEQIDLQEEYTSNYYEGKEF